MWALQSEFASSGCAAAPSEVVDSSFLDSLLAEADDVGSSGQMDCAPLEWVGEHKDLSTPERETAIDPAIVSTTASQLESGQTTSTMRQWQKEASRLWDERVDKIGTTNASTTPAAPKSNSWQRRKRELKQLRDEVAHLEGELKARRAYASGSFPAVHNSEEHRRRLQKRRQYLSIAWKLAAEREEQLKRASMVENARLKQLVERHTELSRALQPALFQQQITAVSLPQQARLQSNVERSGLFIALEQKLTARLPLVEEIVKHTCALAKRPVDMLEINVNDGETAQPAGNILRTKTFPFRVKSVMEIVWRCAENGFREVLAAPTAAFRLSKDSLGMDTVCVLPQQGTDGSACNFHIRGVLKRWVNDKRVLIQFACVTEWLSDTTSSCVTEEFSWNVTLSDEGEPLRRAAIASDSTHMRSSIESTLVSPNISRGSGTRARRELIANVVLPSLSTMVKRMDQTVENTLLDSARAASIRTS